MTLKLRPTALLFITLLFILVIYGVFYFGQYTAETALSFENSVNKRLINKLREENQHISAQLQTQSLNEIATQAKVTKIASPKKISASKQDNEITINNNSCLFQQDFMTRLQAIKQGEGDLTAFLKHYYTLEKGPLRDSMRESLRTSSPELSQILRQHLINAISETPNNYANIELYQELFSYQQHHHDIAALQRILPDITHPKATAAVLLLTAQQLTTSDNSNIENQDYSRYFYHSESIVRTAALHLLKDISITNEVDLLTSALTDPSAEVQLAALDVIAQKQVNDIYLIKELQSLALNASDAQNSRYAQTLLFELGAAQ